MRKTKEDMQLTRNQILASAFDVFYEKGFEASSLEEIARRAGVTRGAIYWHYADKMDLYRAAIALTLEKGDISSFAYGLPQDMTLEERIVEVFWMALDENRYVDFVFKTMSYIVGRAEFDNVFQELRDTKRRLLQFFDEEIRIYLRMNRIEGIEASAYSTALFLMFEGMFLTKNIPIGIRLTRDNIVHGVHLILKDLPSAEEE